MSRIRANGPSEFRFLASDSAAIRAQKLELLRLAVIAEGERSDALEARIEALEP